jgi:endonuclease III-like uncharacterized protein
MEQTANQFEYNDLWKKLVIAILSVNNFPISKTSSILNTLREQGVLNPHNLIHLSKEQIALRLKKAGYDRGEFITKLLADRLQHLGEFIDEVGVERFSEGISNENQTEVTRFLKSVKGVGPVVIHHFFALRSIDINEFH